MPRARPAGGGVPQPAAFPHRLPVGQAGVAGQLGRAREPLDLADLGRDPLPQLFMTADELRQLHARLVDVVHLHALADDGGAFGGRDLAKA